MTLPKHSFMKQFTYVITDPNGMHARPAGSFCKMAQSYASKITIAKEGREADAKRIMGVMQLGIKNGQAVTVSVEGEDEEKAAVELEQFLKENL